MHKKRLLRGALLTTIALGGAYDLIAEDPVHAEPAKAVPAPEVPVARVVVRELAPTVELTGRTRATQEVALRARVPGFVESVAFKEGSLVRKGQLLFVLDPRPLKASAEQAKAELLRAQHDLGLSRLRLERSNKLAPDGIVAPSAHDALVAESAKAEASVAAARAALKAAELELSFTRVVSPIDGRVGEAHVKRGNLISGGSEGGTLLTTIFAVDPLHVQFDVDEPTYLQLSSYLGRASAQSGPSLTVALSGEADFSRPATIDYLGNALDVSTGSAPARALLPNTDGALAPGLFARVRVQTGAPKEAVLIGDRAVFTDQAGRYVLVLNAQHTIEQRRIELGGQSEGLRIVQAGLTRGDQVVLSSMVRPGMQVRGREVEMTGSAAPLASRGTP